MEGSARIRPFQPSAHDYAGIAAVAESARDGILCDFEYTTPDGFVEFDRWFRDAEYRLQRFVAADPSSDAIVGYAQCFHTLWDFARDRYWWMIRVRPDATQRGIGGQLARTTRKWLDECGARELRTMIDKRDTWIDAKLQRENYRILLRSMLFSLDPRVAAQQLSLTEVRTPPAGIEIVTLAHELHQNPDCLAAVFALHVELSREIPLPEHPRMDLERFRVYAVEGSCALPAAFFLAKDGDRYVGESLLQRHPDNAHMLIQKVTGVLPAHRGAGIARVLKQHGVAYAIERQCAITTWVESNNPAMLAINQSLGFREEHAVVLYRWLAE